MTGQVTSYLNEVGDHSAQPPSPDMTLIALLVLQRFLSNHAEQIVSDHRQFQYQGVCIELARGEAFNVHVSLQFAVILLALAMCVVGFDDFVIGPIEICPPHVDLDIRQHEHLAVLINMTL